MRYTEDEKALAKQLEKRDVRRYETDFIDFYTFRSELSQLLGLSLLNPSDKQYEGQLKAMIEPMALLFNRCVHDILNTSSTEQEFGLDVVEFMIEDQVSRTEYMRRVEQNRAYVQYEIAKIYDRVIYIYRLVPDITILTNNITRIFEGMLRHDISAALGSSKDQATS